MNRLLRAIVATVVVMSLVGAARAQGDANAVLDKAIKALGGAERLNAAKAAESKSKGKINFGGQESEFTVQTIHDGLDRFRSEFEGDFGGNKFKGITVINGDKGWRNFGGQKMDMDKEAVAGEKRNIYLQIAAARIVPLKDKAFKVEAAGEEKVGDKPAVALKITGPDGKDFKLFFDKESGLPVKQVAKVMGFMGEEFTQETLYSNYKEFSGVKRAAKVENKRDGERFVEIELVDFKILDKVDAKTFAEPD